MTFNFRHRDDLLWPRFALAFTAALVALACLQSANMVTHAYDLPESALSEWIIARAENWHAWMELIGMSELSERIAQFSSDMHQALVSDDDL